MKLLRTLLIFLGALLLVLCAAGCSASVVSHVEESDNQINFEPAKPVLLVVSFGTSYDSLDASIGAVEAALQDANPDYEVRRAFTSQIIIDILAERGQEIDNVIQAMDRLIADGVKEVIIQPTHVMNGFEYDDVMAEISAYADRFDSMKVGRALLATDDDYTKVIASIVEETAVYNDGETAIVFMGHGTHHEANAVYANLQNRFIDAGYANYFVGTVEAEPTLEQVMTLVENSDAEKVVLLPLMIVAGDHATNDMAGDEEDTWKSAFISAGYEVECVMKGLGEYVGIQQMLVEHAAAAE